MQAFLSSTELTIECLNAERQVDDEDVPKEFPCIEHNLWNMLTEILLQQANKLWHLEGAFAIQDCLETNSRHQIDTPGKICLLPAALERQSEQ